MAITPECCMYTALMLIHVYHAHKPILLHKCSHCFKFAASHKKYCQACPPSILMRFSQGLIPESLVQKKNPN